MLCAGGRGGYALFAGGAEVMRCVPLARLETVEDVLCAGAAEGCVPCA